jgi:hypothetical protein
MKDRYSLGHSRSSGNFKQTVIFNGLNGTDRITMIPNLSKDVTKRQSIHCKFNFKISFISLFNKLLSCNIGTKPLLGRKSNNCQRFAKQTHITS